MTNPVTITAPEGAPFVDITRDFDAPVEAVFRAHQDPELLAKWLGPSGYEMDLTEYDCTTGGHYRFVHRNPAGAEFGFHGVFHLVRDNEMVIQTFEWEGLPDVVSLDSVRFERLPGDRTRLVSHSVYPTQEARDGMIDNGMETGVVEGYEKLDRVLTDR